MGGLGRVSELAPGGAWQLQHHLSINQSPYAESVDTERCRDLLDLIDEPTSLLGDQPLPDLERLELGGATPWTLLRITKIQLPALRWLVDGGRLYTEASGHPLVSALVPHLAGKDRIRETLIK